MVAVLTKQATAPTRLDEAVHSSSCEISGARILVESLICEATGRVGVVLVTSGPGATNAVTGIANAFMDSTPLVVITGQVPRKMIGSDAFQEVDTVGVPRHISC